jgi:hypothetical protein
MAIIHMVPIGAALRIIPKIVAAKMANRCQAFSALLRSRNEPYDQRNDKGDRYVFNIYFFHDNNYLKVRTYSVPGQ